MGSILVTGANGYIGRHVVKSLLDLGHKVYACDLRPFVFDDRADSIECNIFEDSIADKVRVEEIDACVHLAWRDGFVHNSSTHMKDLPKHYEFLTSLVNQGVKQLVVMGSMHEVGYHEGAIDENTPCNPMSLYAIAKDALRRALMIYCKDKVVLQWTRGYYITGDDGNSHSIFTKLLQAHKEGKREFPFTTGKNKYDFITVEELGQQIAAVASQTDVMGIINVCSGQPISLAEKVERYIKENDLNMKLKYGAFPERQYDSPCVYGDTSKIMKIFGR